MSLYTTEKKPIKEIKISSNLSVGLFDDGRIMTMIRGVPFVQCRRAIVNLPARNDEMAKDILVERLNQYNNMDEFLASRSIAEKKADINLEKYKILPEEELFAHASNLQAWIDDDYNIDIIDSSIAFPILAELIKYDENARWAYYYNVEERWINGNAKSRHALLMYENAKAYIVKMHGQCKKAISSISEAIKIYDVYTTALNSNRVIDAIDVLTCIEDFLKKSKFSAWLDADAFYSLSKWQIEEIPARDKMIERIDDKTASMDDVDQLLTSQILNKKMFKRVLNFGFKFIKNYALKVGVDAGHAIIAISESLKRGDQHPFTRANRELNTYTVFMPRYETGKISIEDFHELSKNMYVDKKTQAYMRDVEKEYIERLTACNMKKASPEERNVIYEYARTSTNEQFLVEVYKTRDYLFQMAVAINHNLSPWLKKIVKENVHLQRLINEAEENE